MEEKHKVFISYHHSNDQSYKDQLLIINSLYNIFIDKSVDTGDIDDKLPAETIRTKIRDEYLKDSTVTILLVGTETWRRKYVDWEIYSSMYDGRKNKKSGVLVVNLPSTGSHRIVAGHGSDEKEIAHPNILDWVSLDRSKYEERYPFMPDRIVDNLVGNAKISVVPWNLIVSNPEKLGILINFANKDRSIAQYDLSRPMRRIN